MIAFTFPGQGSQRPNMGSPWVDHPSWELVKDASEATGRDIGDLLLNADAESLSITRNTQLVTFTMSMVILDAIERIGVSPTMCAGHSLGEYGALVAAGAVSYEAGAKLVSERSEAMQSAAQEHQGAMAALLGISDQDAEAACKEVGEGVWVANYNAPGQVVIAGLVESVAAASDIARSKGAKKVMNIPVRGAFHTPYMNSARQRLRKALSDTRFYDLEVPVIANVDALPHQRASEWPLLLATQLTSPVKWTQSLARLKEMGAKTLIEVGTGGVLTGLAKRSVPELESLSVGTPDDLDKLVRLISSQSPLKSYAESHQGEHLYISERMVVSPQAGIFEPSHEFTGSTTSAKDQPPISAISVGQIIGTISGIEVRSPFEGELMGMIAVSGERVNIGQPLAWLRTTRA